MSVYKYNDCFFPNTIDRPFVPSVRIISASFTHQLRVNKGALDNMPVLNMAPPNSVGTSNDNSISSRHMMQKNTAGVRRSTRSKGTIAGFKSPDGSDAPPLTAENSSISLDTSNHAQHLQGDPTIPIKQCHTAKLALLCVQNAKHMGARTQLNLCPPGKARDDLMKALQERRRRRKKALPAPPSMRRNLSFSRSSSVQSIGSRPDEFSSFEKLMGEKGLAEYDEAEGEYLSNPRLHSLGMDSDGEEVQEDPSSGDEDLLDFIFDDDDKFDDLDDQSVREPLYTLGPEGSSKSNQGQGSANSGKLAFNFRKLRWIDSITATDRAEARQYLKKELSSLKKRDAMRLTKHLRALQRREKRRLDIERGRRNGKNSNTSDCLSDIEDDEVLDSINKFPSNMSASVSAALVLESLAFNPLESLDGMSKCYEGIVAAGTALLDFDDKAFGTRPTKREIVNALTPLLITTLEQESGETILALARLRKMCGTKRYQRRFIQRIAPSLVRPPGAALWCLRHQSDMKAILAATELILDYSSEIFASDWFERGRTILADSKRAASLKLAAMQLKRLSAPQQNESMLSSLNGSHHRRGGSLSMITPSKDAAAAGEVLAEWEILAVDREIRDSINNLFNRDWSKINIRHAPPREGESPHPSKKPRGISAVKKSAPPPPESDQSTEMLISPPRVTSKHLLPNALTSAPPTQPTSAKTSESSPKSPRRRPKSLDSSPSPKKEPKATIEPDDLTPPHTPTSQSQPISSPIRPSPPPIEAASPDMKHIISPRPGQAPLSPSKKSYRGRNDSNRVATNSPGSTTSAQSTYLRTLTSTAAERKRTVAACRALRAQITRFENAFARVHGRAPRGANERAPLATTYAQYREWKRAIRSDAASRIQAMYRGARTRSILSQDPRFKRIVKNRAGRPTPIRSAPPQMPSDIGAKNRGNVLQPIPPMPLQRRDDPITTVYDGVEVLLSEGQRKSADDQSMNYSTTGSTSALSTVPYSPRGDGSVSSSNSSDLNYLTLPELQALKRELKQMLKKYDMEFHRQHGRMPVKAEKEPIRNLYEKYNTLKNRLTAVEKDASLVSPRTQWQQQSQSAGNTSQGSIQTFPDYNSTNTDPSTQPSSLPTAPRVPNRATRRPSEQSNPVPPAQGQDLQALRTEKQHLHQMLRAYERDFFRINNRQVSSYNDIRPVASQYRRYKEIKKSIVALQQSQR